MRVLLSLAACVALAGCGGVAQTGGGDAELTLLLGERPSASHVGLFLAVERGFDEAEAVEVTIRRSGAPVRLLRNRRVEAALLSREQIRPAGAVCVLALRQQPVPGPFLCVLQTTLEDRRPVVEALVRAVQRGYGEAEFDPESGVEALLAAAPRLDRATVAAELAEIGPSLAAGAPTFGALDPARFGPPSFDTSLVRPISRD